MRPSLGLPQWGCRPVVGPRQLAHLAAASEKVRRRPAAELHDEGFGDQFQPKIRQPERSRLSQQSHQTRVGPALFPTNAQKISSADAAAATTPASIRIREDALFHEAGSRERTGNDAADVDRAAPRRLGMAIERRPRPQYIGEIRRWQNRRNDLRRLLRRSCCSFLGRCLLI